MVIKDLIAQKSSEAPVQVNFKSDYKATTPVFPTSVAVTPPSVADDQKPPLKEAEQSRTNTDFATPVTLTAPPKLEDSLKTTATLIEIITPPSKFYQPPKFTLPPQTESRTSRDNIENQPQAATIANTSVKPKKDAAKIVHSEKEWKDLRKMFRIPDYEFPLDVVSRPNYGEGPSSFQVNPFVRETAKEK